MAHNPTVTRKSKTSRMEHPSQSQQIIDKQSPKSKIPIIISTRDVQSLRRGKPTSQLLPDTSAQIVTNDLRRLGVCQMVSPPKNEPRAVGGGRGGATAVQKSYIPSPPMTTRSATVQKLTAKESKAMRELTEFRDFKNSKEYKDFKEYKDLKETKTLKESKELQANGAAKPPTACHRQRNQSDRTKNYFDKYLKFAFDLSKPEGVKQLEAHFFPDKDASGAGTSTNRQD